MAIDRRHGRGAKLTIALFLLGDSTALDRLPAGLRARSASGRSALLAICRIGQGLALGGAWDGLASLLALNAPEKPPRLVRHAAAARRADRLHAGERPLRLLPRASSRTRTSSAGAGATRSSSPSRSTSSPCSPAFASSRRTSSRTCFETRELQPVPVAELLRDAGPQHPHRRLRAAGELRPVPPRDRLPDQLDRRCSRERSRGRVPDGAVRRAPSSRRAPIVASGLIADQIGRRTTLAIAAGADRRCSRSAASWRRSCSATAAPARRSTSSSASACSASSYGQTSGAVAGEFRPALPLYRRGAHLRSRLADRRGLRAPRRPHAVEPVRPRLGRRLPPVGRASARSRRWP